AAVQAERAEADRVEGAAELQAERSFTEVHAVGTARTAEGRDRGAAEGEVGLRIRWWRLRGRRVGRRCVARLRRRGWRLGCGRCRRRCRVAGRRRRWWWRLGRRL